MLSPLSMVAAPETCGVVSEVVIDVTLIGPSGFEDPFVSR